MLSIFDKKESRSNPDKSGRKERGIKNQEEQENFTAKTQRTQRNKNGTQKEQMKQIITDLFSIARGIKRKEKMMRDWKSRIKKQESRIKKSKRI